MDIFIMKSRRLATKKISRKIKKRTKLIICFIAAFIVFMIVGGIISSYQQTQQRIQNTVHVYGAVKTKGLGTHPIDVYFVDSNGVSLGADFNVDKYQIDLEKWKIYRAKIMWAGVLGTSGTCDGGTLSTQGYDSYNFDISC